VPTTEFSPSVADWRLCCNRFYCAVGSLRHKGVILCAEGKLSVHSFSVSSKLNLPDARLLYMSQWAGGMSTPAFKLPSRLQADQSIAVPVLFWTLKQAPAPTIPMLLLIIYAISSAHNFLDRSTALIREARSGAALNGELDITVTQMSCHRLCPITRVRSRHRRSLKFDPCHGYIVISAANSSSDFRIQEIMGGIKIYKLDGYNWYIRYMLHGYQCIMKRKL
jgi:hypothetical protein